MSMLVLLATAICEHLQHVVLWNKHINLNA